MRCGIAEIRSDQIRSSLLFTNMAKGILKSSQNDSQEELVRQQSFAGEDDALEGNNTTSRIHTLIRRRVSFAPDVTLHSFDFVPEVSDVRLPRRRSGGQPGAPPGQPGDDEPAGGAAMEMTEVFQPSQEMEMTEIFRPSDESMEFTQVQRAEVSEPMEFTQVQEQPLQKREQEQAEEQEQEQEEPPQVPQVHTPPPKRRKISDSSEDMELSLMKMSPIALPARRAPPSPSPPPASQSLRYSLGQFLNDAGVAFLIDTTWVETQQPVAFPMATLPPPQLRTNEVYAPLYVDMPVLEMSAFVCRELLRRIDQSRRQFDDLEQQVSSSPPPLLLKEYFSSGPEIRQLMNQQLQLVKSFAKLQSKRAWYDWRIQHLKGLQNVLAENLALLQEEQAKLDADLQRARRIQSRAGELLRSLKREVELFKDLPSQVYKKESKLADKLRLEQWRQQLAAHRVALDDSHRLQQQRQAVLSQLESKKQACAQLRIKISSQLSQRKTQASECDLAKLRRKLDLLGVISGVRFRELRGSLLSIECSGLPLVTLDLALCSSAPRQACKVVSDDPFYDQFLQHILSQITSKNDFLTDLLVQLRRSVELVKQYHLLKLLFPMRITANQENIFLELKDYDPQTSISCYYKISIEELMSAVAHEGSSKPISVHVATKSDISLAALTTRFFTKTRKIFPWSNKNRLNMLLG